MLSAQDNELLTRVGPGTPMGELLRRYWTPGAARERGCPPPTATRCGCGCSGRTSSRSATPTAGWGSSARTARTAARRSSSDATRSDGLRCPYHGWKFDVDGACVDMPSEPPSSVFKDKVRAQGVPDARVGRAWCGPTWARRTSSPRSATSAPRSLDAEQVAATKLHTTCNWVQAMEGNLDTSHISWLHQWNGVDQIPDDGSDKPGYPTNAMSWKFWKHDRAPAAGDRGHLVRVQVRRHPHHTQRLHPRADERVLLPVQHSDRVGAVQHPARAVRAGRRREHLALQLQPPADQGQVAEVGGENLFSVSPFEFGPAEVGRNGIIPRRYTAENDYGINREEQRHLTYSGVREFISQDFMVTESMGPIYDRTQERLGTSDKAIIRMRRLLLAAAKRVAAGRRRARRRRRPRLPQHPLRREDPRGRRGLANPRHRRRPDGPDLRARLGPQPRRRYLTPFLPPPLPTHRGVPSCGCARAMSFLGPW